MFFYFFRFIQIKKKIYILKMNLGTIKKYKMQEIENNKVYNINLKKTNNNFTQSKID